MNRGILMVGGLLVELLFLEGLECKTVECDDDGRTKCWGELQWAGPNTERQSETMGATTK
jgi:hypothetical protein